MNPINAEIVRNTPYEFQFQAAGLVFHSWYQLDDLAATSSHYLEFRMGSNNFAHILQLKLRGNATRFDITVYELTGGETVTPGTTPMLYSCNNHIIDTVPDMTPYQDPAVTNLTGAVVRSSSSIFGASQGGQNTVSADPEGLLIERLWKKDTTYIVEIYNADGSPRDFFFETVWYESSN